MALLGENRDHFLEHPSMCWFLTDLLRYNSHNIYFTYLTCTNQWLLIYPIINFSKLW